MIPKTRSNLRAWPGFSCGIIKLLFVRPLAISRSSFSSGEGLRADPLVRRPPEEEFLKALDKAFADSRAHIVQFHNPLLDCDSASTVYVVRTWAWDGASPARLQECAAFLLSSFFYSPPRSATSPAGSFRSRRRTSALCCGRAIRVKRCSRELSVRRLAESCDAAAEKALREAGAAPALVDAIKSGSYAISPADAKAAQEELAAQAARRARETEQLRKFDTLYQDQLARARASAPSKSETPNVLADQFKGDLVSWKTEVWCVSTTKRSRRKN